MCWRNSHQSISISDSRPLARLQYFTVFAGTCFLGLQQQFIVFADTCRLGLLMIVLAQFGTVRGSAFGFGSLTSSLTPFGCLHAVGILCFGSFGGAIVEFNQFSCVELDPASAVFQYLCCSLHILFVVFDIFSRWRLINLSIFCGFSPSMYTKWHLYFVLLSARLLLYPLLLGITLSERLRCSHFSNFGYRVASAGGRRTVFCAAILRVACSHCFLPGLSFCFYAPWL